MQSLFIRGVMVLKNWRFSTYCGFEVTVLYFFVSVRWGGGDGGGGYTFLNSQQIVALKYIVFKYN